MAFNLIFRGSGFILEHKGVTTIQEINEINALLHGHREFDNHKYQIVNLLEADFSKIVQSRAEEPAATDWAASKSRENVKMALVVRQPEAVSFCRQYIKESKEMGSPWSFRIFDSMKEAETWVYED